MSFLTGVSQTKDLIRLFEKTNPLGFDQSLGHQYYEHKVKAFLQSINSLTIKGHTFEWSKRHDKQYSFRQGKR